MAKRATVYGLRGRIPVKDEHLPGKVAELLVEQLDILQAGVIRHKHMQERDEIPP
ncbi:MAG: hypothetical protein J2P54_01130 [Bradyrhizobiaceae bacterium]|nr:hypothetical protein [Bradyrhizobiaceae bacterium]